MVKKYFNEKGEIAFRLWSFAMTVEFLKANPNEEKAQNLKSKMEAYLNVIAEKGNAENLNDIKALINEI